VNSARVESTFAGRLNHLATQVHPHDRGPYTNEEIAAATGVSPQAVRYWRQGKRVDPKMGNLQRLADLFGVPVAYFFDDQVAAKLNAELGMLLAMRDQGVRQIALRAAGLSRESQRAIVEVVRQIRQLEGLDPDVGGQPSPGG
jgi:ESX-1-secreted protein regulator